MCHHFDELPIVFLRLWLHKKKPSLYKFGKNKRVLGDAATVYLEVFCTTTVVVTTFVVAHGVGGAVLLLSTFSKADVKRQNQGVRRDGLVRRLPFTIVGDGEVDDS